jgi:thymidine kinase
MTERLKVFAGSMFSGKTERLIWLLTRAEIAGRKTQVFKPIIDNRYGAIKEIQSHSKAKHDAIPLTTAVEILEHIEKDVDIVAIDEAQFWDDDIVPVVSALLEADIEVFVAGLPLDFKGEPFGPMPALIVMADDIERLTAICTYDENGDICGAEATRTQRFIDGKPANYYDPVILVGGKAEGYSARCPSHHVVIDKPHGIVFQSK